MAKVIWRPDALERTDAIAAYIEQFNPYAAAKTYMRLRRLGDSLRSAPRRTRPADGGRRQLGTVRPDVVTYDVAEDEVSVVDIRHSARQPLA